MSDIDSYAARRQAPPGSIGELRQQHAERILPLPNPPKKAEFTITRERLTPQNRSIGPDGALIIETDNTLPGTYLPEDTGWDITYLNDNTKPPASDASRTTLIEPSTSMYSCTLRHNGKGTTLKLRYAVLALWISMTNPKYNRGWSNSVQAAIYRLAQDYPREKSTSGLSGYVMDRMCFECDTRYQFIAGGSPETDRFNSILEQLQEEK